MLTNAFDGFGEPLNLILSGQSDPQVLSDTGFHNYWQSLNFSTECFGQHSGGYQAANLGDGNGSINQTGLFRYDFGNTGTGTCIESLDGGNHMRFWRQNGSSENTGAYFIAASIELNSTLGHDIEPNGYDLGRDAILAVANTSTSLNGVDYKTTVQMVSGLLSNGSAGINHGISIDGLVGLMTVAASGTMTNASSSAGSTSTNKPGKNAAVSSISMVGYWHYVTLVCTSFALMSLT